MRLCLYRRDIDGFPNKSADVFTTLGLNTTGHFLPAAFKTFPPAIRALGPFG